MRKFKLTNTFQGIRGGKNNHNECGYSLVTLQDNGDEKVSIEVDTFEGFGDSYKERENVFIKIEFRNYGESWRGTIEELYNKLKK